MARPTPSCGVKLRAARLIASPIAVPCLEINEGLMDSKNILAEI